MRDGIGKRAASALFLCGVLVMLAVSSAIVSSAMYILSFPGQASGITKDQVTKHMKKESFKQADIYYTSKEKSLLPLTKETLEYAVSINQIMIGYSNQKPIDIIFFPNEKQMEAYSGLLDVVGFYSEREQLIGLLPEEKKKLLEGDEVAVYLYQRLLIHEYSHHAFHQKLKELETDPDEFPLWFHEGLSEWIANYELLIDPITFSVVPFDRLQTDRDWQEARAEYDTDVYLQSFYMIDELTGKYGKDIISEMIKETAKKGDFEKGFKSATKESLDQFEKDFKKKFEKNSAALDSIYPMPLLLVKSLLTHSALCRRHLSLGRGE
ncbi:hypothetical protein ACWA16_05555 [Bacillus subtilis]|uniref:hypothetical protein n=1 Tax=Bacillus subtilis TaxID=1423 RepID=UPI0013D6DC4A|nr:hypothetical protein [Bacillus subtilis]MBA5715180.1 hypothetical protein [Bacillus subtilis]NRF42366.1 hypothetical protein [Bacillus subtilis]UHH06798.1 hypothetical protein LUM37_00860 [Bacillus subtilis]